MDVRMYGWMTKWLYRVWNECMNECTILHEGVWVWMDEWLDRGWNECAILHGWM